MKLKLFLQCKNRSSNIRITAILRKYILYPLTSKFMIMFKHCNRKEDIFQSGPKPY